MFTRTDLVNLHNLIVRSKFNGLEEAEVAVYLSQKIKQQVAYFDLPKEVADGGNVQRLDQPGAESGK